MTNMNDRVTQVEGWVLTHYHSFYGGLILGYIAHWPIGWLLHAL